MKSKRVYVFFLFLYLAKLNSPSEREKLKVLNSKINYERKPCFKFINTIFSIIEFITLLVLTFQHLRGARYNYITLTKNFYLVKSRDGVYYSTFSWHIFLTTFEWTIPFLGYGARPGVSKATTILFTAENIKQIIVKYSSSIFARSFTSVQQGCKYVWGTFK